MAVGDLLMQGARESAALVFTLFSQNILVSAPEELIDGLVQDCSISIANALEILQSCTS